MNWVCLAAAGPGHPELLCIPIYPLFDVNLTPNVWGNGRMIRMAEKEKYADVVMTQSKSRPQAD